MLNYKYPEYTIGFRWILHARCGYTFDARVAKVANRIEDDCPEQCHCYCYRKKNSNPRLEHWFSKGYLFREFRDENEILLRILKFFMKKNFFFFL